MKKIITILIFLLISLSIYAQPTDSLVAYYPFTGNANDMSNHGNAQHGEVYGATLTSDKFNVDSSAYYFNGNNAYISVSDNSGRLKLNNTDFTISFWILVSEFKGQDIINKKNSSGGWIVSMNTNRIVFYNSQQTILCDSILNLNVWTHITIVYKQDSSKMMFYINGNLMKTANNISSPTSSSTVMEFGRDRLVATTYHKGKLDEIRIYKRCLSQSEITQIYNYQNMIVPTLLLPLNNSNNISLTPVLSWTVVPGASLYKVQVSSSNTFGIITDSSTVSTNQYQIPSGKLQSTTTYYWRVKSQNNNNVSDWSNIWNFTTTTTTNINETELNNNYYISQNYPNPFNTISKIEYTLPKNEFVKLNIFDINGKLVKTLVNKEITIGTHTVWFDGDNLSSGIYYYKLETKNYSKIKKMILIK